MHEVSICQAALETLRRELESRRIPPQKVTRLVLAVGALRQVIPEFMQEAFELLTRRTPLQRCRLELKIIPFTVTCHGCGHSHPAERIVTRCPRCGSDELEISGGDGLLVESFAVEEREVDEDGSQPDSPPEG